MTFDFVQGEGVVVLVVDDLADATAVSISVVFVLFLDRHLTKTIHHYLTHLPSAFSCYSSFYFVSAFSAI